MYPAPASQSAWLRRSWVIPRRSWMTTTAGHGPVPEGTARYAGSSPCDEGMVRSANGFQTELSSRQRVCANTAIPSTPAACTRDSLPPPPLDRSKGPSVLTVSGSGANTSSRHRAYGSSVRRVPWWGLVSSIAAPLLLIGGWTVAAAVQPTHFDAFMRTISELAARDIPQRWLMTVALAGVGLSHLATACALGSAGAAGRVVLGLGGLATLLVAAFPLPGGGRSSPAHTAAAAVPFVSLAVWPAFASARPRVPGRTLVVLMRPQTSAVATCTLLLLLAWFFVEQLVGGQRVGLAERVAAGAQALWPLAVVVSVRRSWPSPAGASSSRP